MKKQSKTRFGTLYQECLRRHDMTQSSVAKVTGNSRSYVSQVIVGKKSAGPNTVDSMANAIDATDGERRELHRAAASDAGFRIDLPDDF